VQVELATCPLRVTYWSNVRRQGQGKPITRNVWLVEVRVLGWTGSRGCCSPIGQSRTHRVRCASLSCIANALCVEDSFKFLKTCLGWEEVQLLDLRGIRTLVALAWVAAGFLFDLGVTFEWAEVQLLAKLGGWNLIKIALRAKSRSCADSVASSRCWLPRPSCLAMRLNIKDFHPTSPPCYMVGNLQRIYE
jgi:hypothetical protein